MSDVDLDSFPVAARGHQFEDFSVGQTFEHHWGRTILDSDNALFSTATCNWNPLHLNAEYARSEGHRDVVVNPMLVLCTVVGLSVEDLSEAGGPFLGMEDVEFHEPVHPGDTLLAKSEVVATRTSDSRPGVGIVTWRTEARNENGHVVLTFERSNLVARRSGQ